MREVGGPSAGAVCLDSGQPLTTFSVTGLSEVVTQQEFLDAVNKSGFAGAYDFAYLPRSRNTFCSSGRAFVNLRTPELAADFRMAWQHSQHLAKDLGDRGLNVVLAVVQGFDANLAKWTLARTARVKNMDFLPFFSQVGVGSQATDHVGSRREATRLSTSNATTQAAPTTLVVRNLPECLTQEKFLEEVDLSGFAGMYDFAYVPRNRDSGRCAGRHAFVNFKLPQVAEAFSAAWHGSARFRENGNIVALNVALATVQGFHENVSRWTGARAAKAKNQCFLPFILEG